MKIIADINTSFQNSIVGLATIIYENLTIEKSIDEIYEECKKIYADFQIKSSIFFDDIYEALLLLYSIDRIEKSSNGKVCIKK